MKYRLLDTSTPGENADSIATIGPEFDSVKAAKAWLTSYAKEVYSESCQCLREGDGPFFDKYLLVQVLETIAIEPEYKFKISLRCEDER